MPTMTVDFSVFGTWYEIDSWFEGQFLERTMPGSFKKTIQENGDNVKVLFDHGMDSQIGNKVLGSIATLSEEVTGPHAEVPLFDTSYNRDLLPGLEAGVYGSSFRFRVIKEEWNDEPGESDWNPKGLPERSIKEVRLMEFGPVTFPANPDSTAGVRALTDEYYGRVRSRQPEAYADLVSRAQSMKHAVRATAPAPKAKPSKDTADPGTMAGSLDAVLDQAVALLAGVDTADLDPVLLQAIALVYAAETISDGLLDCMGVDDPDDDDGTDDAEPVPADGSMAPPAMSEMNSTTVKPGTRATSHKRTPLVDLDAVKAEIDKRAAGTTIVEPLNKHSVTPFKPTVGKARVRRKAAFMQDYLSLIVKEAERNER
jgi:HK97 family phage prohead protease